LESFDNGFTFDFGAGTVKVNKIGDSFGWLLQSSNGRSYINFKYQKSHWDSMDFHSFFGNLTLNRADLHGYIYRLITEDFDFTSQNKCKWNSLQWKYHLKCTTTGCNFIGSGDIDGVAFDNYMKLELNASGPHHFRSGFLKNIFNRPANICLGNELMDEWSGIKTIKWDAHKYRNTWVVSKIKVSVRKPSGPWRSISGKATIDQNIGKFYLSGDDVSIKIRMFPINGLITRHWNATTYHIQALRNNQPHYAIIIPGLKQAPAIKAAVVAQYGWIRQSIDLLKETPISSVLYFLIWADDITGNLNNNFDCSSIVKASLFFARHIKHDIELAAIASETCSKFNTLVVHIIKVIADNLAPLIRATVPATMDKNSNHNTYFEQRWLDILA